MKKQTTFILFAVIFSFFANTAESKSILKDVRINQSENETRLVLDLSEKVKYKLFTLNRPDRIVIDLYQADLGKGLKTNFNKAGLINGIRIARNNSRRIRMVIETSEILFYRLSAIPKNPNPNHRLVIDLKKAFEGSKKVAASSVNRKKFIVAIDPGHGGEDPGASGPGGLREKTVVLQIARRLESQLVAIPGFKPVLVRTGDYYVSLKNRRDRARASQADLFVSIHADAFIQKSANGASVYALSNSGTTSDAAKYLADSENSADLIGGVELNEMDRDLALTLTDLSMDKSLDASHELGELILEQIGGVARLHKQEVERAGFAVLRSPDVPSLLIETGFISNPREAKRLSTPVYQDKLASAIRRGIQSWFVRKPPPGTLLAWQRKHGRREVTISSGDTLSEIAERYGVTVASIKTSNGLSRDVIYEGQTLVIPEA